MGTWPRDAQQQLSFDLNHPSLQDNSNETSGQHKNGKESEGKAPMDVVTSDVGGDVIAPGSSSSSSNSSSSSSSFDMKVSSVISPEKEPETSSSYDQAVKILSASSTTNMNDSTTTPLYKPFGTEMYRVTSRLIAIIEAALHQELTKSRQLHRPTREQMKAFLATRLQQKMNATKKDIRKQEKTNREQSAIILNIQSALKDMKVFSKNDALRKHVFTTAATLACGPGVSRRSLQRNLKPTRTVRSQTYDSHIQSDFIPNTSSYL